MTDLHARFRSYDTIPVPEYWPDVLSRVEAGPDRSAAPSRRWLLPVVLGLLLVGLVGGALLLGSRLVPIPAPPETPAPSSSPSAAPSDESSPGVVAYEELDRIWIVNVDGTGKRGIGAEVPGYKHLLGWLPDGSAVVYRKLVVDGGRAGIGLIDLDGTERVAYEDLCPVGLDSCSLELESVGISPDGTSVAYALTWPTPAESVNHSAIAILELATGRVTKVDSTETSFPAGVCDAAAGQGENRSPTWSADGTRLVFIRYYFHPLEGPCRGMFTVNADGSDLREVALPDALQGQLPVWSPDGSAFFVNAEGDIYTGRGAFTDIRAVTSDGLSSGWGWTRDGRIIFTRWSSLGSNRQGDLWVMDADGGNPTPLEPTLPALTAAGCVVCPYPSDPDAEHPIRDFFMTLMFWQPLPGGQP